MKFHYYIATYVYSVHTSYSVTTVSQVDDPQKDTDDAPVVTAPTSDDGTNQDKHDSTVCS